MCIEFLFVNMHCYTYLSISSISIASLDVSKPVFAPIFMSTRLLSGMLFYAPFDLFALCCTYSYFIFVHIVNCHYHIWFCCYLLTNFVRCAYFEKQLGYHSLWWRIRFACICCSRFWRYLLLMLVCGALRAFAMLWLGFCGFLLSI